MRMRVAAAFTLALASTLSTALASAPPAEALPIAAPATVVTKTGCFRDGDWDETRGLLWVLRSSDGCATLTLRSYNPTTDTWGTAVSVASDTIDVAVAADDGSIFVARFDGTVQRRTLPSLAVATTFTADASGMSHIVASDVDPDLVVVDTGAGEIKSFDAGVPLGTPIQGSRLAKIGFERFVALYRNADRVITLAPTGLSATGEIGIWNVLEDGYYDDGEGRIYLPDGRILDSSTFTLTGVVGKLDEVSDVYRDPYSDDLHFSARQTAFVRSRSTGATSTIAEGLGGYDTVAIGAGRTAQWDSLGLYLEDVRTAARTPLPNVTNARRVDAQTLVVDRLDGAMAAHAASDRLYATSSGLTAGNGNAVFQLDSTTGRVLKRLWLGDEPGEVAVSDDGTRVYAALATGWIVRIDTATMTEVDRFLPRPYPGRLVTDLIVLRDRPDSIAARVDDEVVIVDGTTPRPNRMGGQWVSPGRTADEIYTTCGTDEDQTCIFNPCEPDPDCPLGLIRLRGTHAFTLTAAGFPKNAGRSVDRVGESLIMPDQVEWGSGDPVSMTAAQLARFESHPAPWRWFDESRGLIYAWGTNDDFSVEVADPPAHVGTVTPNNGGGTVPVLIDSGRFAQELDQGLAIVTMSVATRHEGEFTALTPTRILDTRSGLGRNGRRGALTAGQTIAVDVADAIDVPVDDVTAIVMNVTVTQPTAGGYLTVYPSDVARPEISNINFAPGDTIPNLATVAVGPDGKVKIHHPYGSSHVLLDVVGFYTGSNGVPGARFRAIEPTRVLDTRSAVGVRTRTPIGPGEEIVFDAVAATPAGDRGTFVRAVVLNVTAVGATTPTFVTVYPSDVERPEASNLNPLPGRANANQVIARVGADGAIRLYNHLGDVHLIADIAGYFFADYEQPGGRFVPYVPERILDTRVDSPFPAPGWLPPESLVYFDGLSTSPYGAFVLNTTATQPTSPGYLSVAPWRGGSEAPPTSSVNFLPGMTIANHVIVQNADGIGFWNEHGYTHVVADVFGGFLKDDRWDEATSQEHSAPTTPAPGPFDDPEGASLASPR